MIFCPVCNARSIVQDSRIIGTTARRRRECSKCQERWTTYEVSSSFVSYGREMAGKLREISSSVEEASAFLSAAAEDYQVDDHANADVTSVPRPRKRRVT